ASLFLRLANIVIVLRPNSPATTTMVTPVLCAMLQQLVETLDHKVFRGEAKTERSCNMLPSEQHEWTTAASLNVIRRSAPSKRLPACSSVGGRNGSHAQKAGRF